MNYTRCCTLLKITFDMARYRDQAPVSNTCPLIDEVISAVDDATFEENSWWDKESVTAILEKIRSANSELREWGNDEYERAEDAEKERDTFEAEKLDLEEELRELKERVAELEEELSAVA